MPPSPRAGHLNGAPDWVNQESFTEMKAGIPGLNVVEGSSTLNPIKKDLGSQVLRDLIKGSF